MQANSNSHLEIPIEEYKSPQQVPTGNIVTEQSMQVSSPPDLHIFSDLAARAADPSNPQIQVQANQQLVQLVDHQQQPLAFLVQTLLCSASPPQSKQASAQLLLNYVSVSTFAEFQNQVNSVEQAFSAIVSLMVQTTKHEILQKLLTRLTCQIAAQYWLDSQCFERFVADLRFSFDPDSKNSLVPKALAAGLVQELVGNIKILVAACENGSTADDLTGSGSQAVGRSTHNELDSLNHKAYKTIILFQSEPLLLIFDFISETFQRGAHQEQLSMISLLTDILKLNNLKLKTGRNQLSFKLAETETRTNTLSKLKMFCSPRSITDFVKFFILGDTLAKEAHQKVQVAELVQQMLQVMHQALPAECALISSEQRSEIDQLVMLILEAIKSGKLPQDSCIQMMQKVNMVAFELCQEQTQSAWVDHLVNVVSWSVENLEKIQFSSFQKAFTMWYPISSLIDQGKVQGKIASIGEVLSEQAIGFMQKLQSCLMAGISFQDDDLFDEHLDNPVGIKEILCSVTRAACLSPTKFLGSLQEMLGSQLLSKNQSEQRSNAICWLIHALRVFYWTMIQYLPADRQSKVAEIHQERVKCAAEAAKFILKLKPELEASMASQQMSHQQAGCLQYAMIKAIETVAKSLLSKCLLSQPQSEFAQLVASSMGLASSDQILTMLIEFSLITLSTQQSSSHGKSQLGLIEKCALKILTYLTVMKPYVPRDSRNMTLKYFTVELQTLVQLKDYLCQVLQGAHGQIIRRQAVKSLSELMCEFDTMSETGEVIEIMYQQISQGIDKECEITSVAGQAIGLIGHINNLRGVHEGIYRQKQYMVLIRNFLMDSPDGVVRAKLSHVLENQQSFSSVEQRALYVKALLGLLQEITYDRDDRMGFDERTCISIQFLKCMIGLTSKCLTIIRDLDLQNRAHQELAMKVLKKAIQVVHNLGSNAIMNQKALLQFPAMKHEFQVPVSLLLEGLKMFVPPLQVNQLKQSTQSLIFKFIQLLYQRNFGLVLELAQKDVSYFIYTQELIAEGLQSTQSCPMLSSFECIDQMYNQGFKIGNKEFKESLVALLSTQASIVNVFKRLLKQNLRSFVRGEQTNQNQKIHVTLRLVTMYLNIGETQFYPICAREVAKESNDLVSVNDELGPSQKVIYDRLIDAVHEIDWKRKRIEPNIKQVAKKLNSSSGVKAPTTTATMA